jgi:2-succinyl-5-enolpyruvyl-6-hydroxy-3-cyclohexene-1-carboxylate synthase
MDQVKLYGDHVRWFVDVAPPEANPPAKTLRYLRALACRALATAAGAPPGPVHLNFPFRKPLEPIPVPGDLPAQPERPVAWAIEGREAGQPFTTLSRGVLTPSPQQVETLAEAIGGATRGLILCGPRCPGGEFPQAVLDLAQTAGFLILADALSGIRFSTSQGEANPGVLGGYETFLQKEGASRWDPPEIILQFGAMPTSQALINYLEAVSERSRHVLITGSGVWTDETHSLSDLIWADPALTCQAVVQKLADSSLAPRDLYWRAAWEEAEKAVWQTIEFARQETFFEGSILVDVIEAMPHSGLLYVASSLPVRHLDQFVAPKRSDLRVFANRGVSGIDGTISSALGAAAATERPLVLVLGDIAFYHDLNGLLALQRCGLKATIVLINNDGGGIFHRLPIAQFDPPFSELFLTPHGLQFEPVVRMFGAHYQKAATRESFRQSFQEALQAEQSWVMLFE